jgi:hypothetical protein
MWSATVKAVADATVMTVTIPFRVILFLLVAACGALCQERTEDAGLTSLPDAPSALASARMESSVTFSDERSSSFATAKPGVTRESELGSVGRPTQPAFVVLNAKPGQENSNDLFDKYLRPTLLKRNLNYHPSSSDSLVGRAAYAASRIFVTHDETGKAKVNTSYFVGVLSSAALRMAYRPYWNRSATTPFSDFGSTVGNDAGMNLLHEFRPGLEQLMKNHAPKFVSKIEERIGH